MGLEKDLDRVAKLSGEEEKKARFGMNCFSPDDGKYGSKAEPLKEYLTPGAEWEACAEVQLALLKTRKEFGQAEQKHIDELEDAIEKIDPLNIQLIESEVTHHDQLAVLEELGRYISDETAALLYPGTTSYDILDTARAHLFKGAWHDVVRPQTTEVVEKLADLGERFIDEEMIRAGRTHLQYTSPVYFGSLFASTAARLTDRIEDADSAFDDLRGKVSGIVGTGAGVEMCVGEGKSLEFEEKVLEKFDLEPDYTAFQVTQKERLADVGHALVTLDSVLADFAGDVRLLYSSGIEEAVTGSNADRLGGSSTDAAKNNPINYENIEGKSAVIESGMNVLYDIVKTDLERDLRSSVQARYQPQGMMVEAYESFKRTSKVLDKIIVLEDNIEENLSNVRGFPSEPMVTILKGEGFVHSEYGTSHEFVKEMSRKAKSQGRTLLGVCEENEEFCGVYSDLPQFKRDILEGELEDYLDSADEKARKNIEYARNFLN